MTKDEVMQLIDEYAQEVKDFGYIDDSQIYKELKSAVYKELENDPISHST